MKNNHLTFAILVHCWMVRRQSLLRTGAMSNNLDSANNNARVLTLHPIETASLFIVRH